MFSDSNNNQKGTLVAASAVSVVLTCAVLYRFNRKKNVKTLQLAGDSDEKAHFETSGVLSGVESPRESIDFDFPISREHEPECEPDESKSSISHQDEETTNIVSTVHFHVDKQNRKDLELLLQESKTAKEETEKEVRSLRLSLMKEEQMVKTHKRRVLELENEKENFMAYLAKKLEEAREEAEIGAEALRNEVTRLKTEIEELRSQLAKEAEPKEDQEMAVEVENLEAELESERGSRRVEAAIALSLVSFIFAL